MTPTDRHEILRETIDLQRIFAWERAKSESEARDQHTSKIRFGSVALNAATLATVLNARSALQPIGEMEILASALFFTLGIICAGASLLSQQTQLIRTAGRAGTLALISNRAVTLARFPIYSAEWEDLEEVLSQTEEIAKEGLFEAGVPAIILQNFSTGSWLAGAVTLALAKASLMLPSISWPSLG